ncbi:family 20 glycosylhydrolase [Shewanella waksmanii]|uniref:family 20 glycosylhydrolase n=1 Tax=Shewanella waksmanii TaxID=213783 RepID=UPI00373588C5
MNRLITHLTLLIILFSGPLQAVEANSTKQTTAVHSLMPKPQSLQLNHTKFVVSDNMTVAIRGYTVDAREQLTTTLAQTLSSALQRPIQLTHTSLEQAQIVITIDNSLAHRPILLGDDESYQLNIDKQAIRLHAANELGINHGVTTLSQWLYGQKHQAAIQGVIINDQPRYPWRGLLIDSSRHFMPIDTIKRQIDGMASAKLNVLHWHLTDDQGWRFQSSHYPKLTQLASDGEFYTQQQLRDIVSYAAKRGIRVVPEMDVPGHASAIAVAYPELMSQPGPYEMERHWGVFDPILDPTNPEVYQFVDKLVGELAAIFPDPYLHIGGDEVPPTQWLNNADIVAFMQQNQFKDGEDLHAYFNQRVSDILQKHQRIMMGWDEVFHPQLPKQTLVQSWRGLDSLAQITAAGHPGLLSTGFYIDQPQYAEYHYRNELTPRKSFTSPPFSADAQAQLWQLQIPRLKGSAVAVELLLTDDLNHGYVRLNDKFSRQISPTVQGNIVSFSLDTWMGPLRVELDTRQPNQASQASQPSAFIGNSYYPMSIVNVITGNANQLVEQTLQLAPLTDPNSLNNILGGEATIWAELVTADNIDTRIWPRLYVIAERFWSAKSATDTADMYQRLNHIQHYAEEVVKLQHQSQQLKGWQQLLTTNNANVQPLTILAQALEPAHYYTRHHIKYQQQLYHQQAPLNAFVDYLAVESLPLALFAQQLQSDQYSLSDNLTTLSGLLQHWKTHQSVINGLIDGNPQLKELAPFAAQVEQVTNIGLKVIAQCKTAPITAQKAREFDRQLLKILAQQTELVVASAHSVRALIPHCI